jgi:hypothetical protein
MRPYKFYEFAELFRAKPDEACIYLQEYILAKTIHKLRRSGISDEEIRLAFGIATMKDDE